MKHAWALASFCFLLAMGAAPVLSESGTIRVEANIDGLSTLVVFGNNAQWHHSLSAAPGRYAGQDRATFLDGDPWFPEWPEPGENRDCQCVSDVYDGLSPGLPQQPMTVELHFLFGRDPGRVSILQAPSAANGYVLALEFDDDGVCCDADYGVEIRYQTEVLPANNALRFTGTELAATIGDPSLLSPAGELTVEAWMFPEGDNGNFLNFVLSKNLFPNGWALLAEPSGGGRSLRLEINSDPGQSVFQPGVLRDRGWTHVAGVWNDGFAQLFVNGALVDSSPTAAPATSTTPLFVGSSLFGTGTFFSGLVDEVRVWSSARSAEQIRADMSRSLQGDEAGLVGYWRFDEGEGHLSFDLTGNGNDLGLGAASGFGGTTAPAWVSSTAPVCCGDVPREPVTGPEATIIGAAVEPETPAVAYSGDGEPTVFWKQIGPGGTVICLQFVDAEGGTLTPPLLANVTQGLAAEPTGVVDGDGVATTFWVLAEGQQVRAPDGRLLLAGAQGHSILGRRFQKNGQPFGPEIPVVVGGGEVSNPRASNDAGGDIVLSWDEGGEAKARVFDGEGRPRGGPLRLDDGTGALEETSVAKARAGAFVAVWRQGSGPNVGIRARRFRRDGTPKGAAFTVTPSPGATQPSAAVGPDGGFVVAWEQEGGGGADVMMRRYDPEGVPIAAAERANTTLEGDQTRPRLAINAAGDFTIAWESSQLFAATQPNASSVAGLSIVGRTFDPKGRPITDEFVVATPDGHGEPQRPDVTIEDKDDVTVVYERRGGGGSSRGIFRTEVQLPLQPGVCEDGPGVLCLADFRFRVGIEFETGDGAAGAAGAVTLTRDSGFFWFFDPSNVEVLVKVLDACAINGRYWVFATGLTDVQAQLRVDDTLTGQSRSYFNPLGPFAPVLDTDAFAGCPAGSSVGAVAPVSAAAALRRLGAEAASLVAASIGATPGPAPAPAGVAAACEGDATSLCLAGGRFRVEADFDTGAGTGRANAAPLTSDTGTFWFFGPDNVELVVKVLDGCALNGRYWVFAGGLTDVEVDLRVTDTATGAVTTYFRPRGAAFQPILDTSAFASCAAAEAIPTQ